jgi:hypothetical protein
LNALYHHNFRVREAEPGEPSGGTPRLFYIVVFVAFLVANPAVLLPDVWNYLNAYMGERLLVHTGYLFGEQLYRNNFSASPFGGTPVYFYGLFMAIKIPLAVLVAFVVGLFISLRRWRQPGYAFVLFMFLFWIVPYSLIGAKWLRYTLSLMPFVYMLAAIGVVEIGRFILSRWAGPRSSLLVPAAVVLLFIGAPALIAFGHGPHYALYTNALGAGSAGYYFPHDEFYDDGLREALKFVTDTAEEEAVVAHETPAVARYYLSKFNRQDLQSVAMSGSDFDPARTAKPTYAILQSGRVYFENREKLSFIKSNFKEVHEVKINGLSAAEVYVNH